MEGLIGAGAVLVGVVGGCAWRRGVRSSSLEHEVVVLHGLVEDLRRTHEHHRSELDRRLGGIEETAARAETETRMVCAQLVGEAGLVARVEQLEVLQAGRR